MIWGETDEQRHARRYTWHRWFAWRPVRVNDGRWVWRETVARKRVDGINGMKWWAYEARRTLPSSEKGDSNEHS